MNRASNNAVFGTAARDAGLWPLRGLGVTGLVPFALWLSAGALLGQEVRSGGGAACAEGRIVNVYVQTGEVFEDGRDGMLGAIYGLGNRLHMQTRKGLVRRELLFEPGDCFDDLRLRESERLLRGFRFLKSADVAAIARDDGDYDVRVTTRDDWSLRIEPEVGWGGGVDVSGISVAEHNVLGTGRTVDLVFEAHPGPERYGVIYSNPQWMKTRWDLRLAAGRTEPGVFASALVAFPFIGLVGHKAAFVESGYSETWFRFVAGDSEESHHVVQPFVRKRAQLGLALRRAGPHRGRATRLGTYGASLSFERLDYDGLFFPDSTSGDNLGLTEAGADSVAREALRPRNTVRLNFLVGVRALEFITVRGLNSLDAVEDVGLGASADLVLGLAAPAIGSDDRHLLVGIDGYVGARLTDEWIGVIRGSFEGRRDYEERLWRDMFGALDVSGHWQPNRVHTVSLSGRFSAGWQASIPFQLTLGGHRNLRGYSSHRWPGGARAVLSLESRTYLGSAGELFDLGTTAFVDLGRTWANEAPFGTNSGWRASVGGGFRLAAPAGSRTTYQAEVAVPVDSRTSLGDVVFNLRISRLLGIATRAADLDLERSRDVGLRSAFRNLE